MHRICHITTAHQADDVRIFHRECRSLAARSDLEVIIIGPGTVPPGLGVTHVPIAQPPEGRAGRFATSAPRAHAAARRTPATIYHFHDPELLPLALWYARRGRRVVWDAHEDYLEEFNVHGPKDWAPKAFRRGIQWTVSSLLSSIDEAAAGIVGATQTIADTYTNANTVVVGNEARTSDFAGALPSFGTKRVLYTGYVGEQYCFREVFEGIAALPDVTLVVAGRPPVEDVWQDAVARLGPRLVQAGWMDRNGLVALMSTCSAGLVTYSDVATNQTNAPNKLYEFLAAGLPVVATPNRGISQLLHDSGGGTTSTAFSAKGIAQAISDLLASESQWRSRSEAGRSWVRENGSWERSERILFELYDRILETV